MRIEFNKVVNFDKRNNEITFLEDVFEDENGKGATGTVFVPISKAQYDEDTSFDNLKAFLKNCLECVPDDFVDVGWNGYTQSIIDSCEEGYWRYDMSCSNLWDKLRAECGLSESDAYIFNCIRCGRLF